MDLQQMEALPNSQSFATSVLADEDRGTDARNNQAALRAGKWTLKENCILPEQTIKKLKPLMVKAYVQLAFIADFPKKRNSTDRENTVPRGNLIPSETLEYLENRGSEQKNI